jgi:hypothetical protein
MSTGTYGIVRAADVDPSDVQITVFYSPNRQTQTTNTFTLGSNNLVNIGDSNTGIDVFGGLYTLNLPVSQFQSKGIYTIAIKPVEIRAKIVDCGVLSALPDNKGIVFDVSDPNLSPFTSKFENNNLIGYRIEYLDIRNPTKKVRNLFRVITSNNRSEPVTQNLTNTNQKAIRYRFNDNATLVFCTVTPNAPTNVKPDVVPYIGVPNQEVILTHTFFNPIMIEVEMIEHDFDTLAYGLFGNQTKGLEDGIYTVYNFDNNIYKQYNLFEIKDRFTGKPLHEVREERTNIDFTKNFNDIANV